MAVDNCINKSRKTQQYSSGCKALAELTPARCTELCPFYKTQEQYKAEVKICEQRNRERLGYRKGQKYEQV